MFTVNKIDFIELSEVKWHATPEKEWMVGLFLVFCFVSSLYLYIKKYLLPKYIWNDFERECDRIRNKYTFYNLEELTDELKELPIRYRDYKNLKIKALQNFE